MQQLRYTKSKCGAAGAVREHRGQNLTYQLVEMVGLNHLYKHMRLQLPQSPPRKQK